MESAMGLGEGLGKVFLEFSDYEHGLNCITTTLEPLSGFVTTMSS